VVEKSCGNYYFHAFSKGRVQEATISELLKKNPFGLFNKYKIINDVKYIKHTTLDLSKEKIVSARWRHRDDNKSTSGVYVNDDTGQSLSVCDDAIALFAHTSVDSIVEAKCTRTIFNSVRTGNARVHFPNGLECVLLPELCLDSEVKNQCKMSSIDLESWMAFRSLCEFEFYSYYHQINA